MRLLHLLLWMLSLHQLVGQAFRICVRPGIGTLFYSGQDQTHARQPYHASELAFHSLNYLSSYLKLRSSCLLSIEFDLANLASQAASYCSQNGQLGNY